MERNKLVNCIALYDFEGDRVDHRGWLKYFIKEVNAHSLEPGSLAVPGSRKLLQYKTGLRKLEKLDFQGDLVGIYAGVLEPGTWLDWKAVAVVKNSKNSRASYSYFCFIDEVWPWSTEFFENIVKELVKYCPFQYGIGYRRDYEMGPDSYAVGGIEGLGYSPEERQKRDKIAAWMHCRFPDGKYRLGLLRDLYPLNFLTQVHLDEPVDGQRLEDWIHAAPHRGTLVKLTDHHWSWRLNDEEITTLRPLLNQAGLLLCA